MFPFSPQLRSIGIFGRALDINTVVKTPNLTLTASLSSRDVTIQKALDVLHANNYDIAKALLSLVPNNTATICKDELEEWSPAEANLFDESIDKYGKSFNEIRKDVLPWKRMKNIVEYYYMWKTTERYVTQKRIKATEAESKLKQVYVPNQYKQMNGNINGAIAGDVIGKNCESCNKSSSNLWYPYVSGQVHNNERLCQSCWIYFKRFGGLRYPNKYSVDKEKLQNQSNHTNENGQNSSAQLNNNSSSLTKDTNHLNNTNSTSDEQIEKFKCKDCNKEFCRQGNKHVVLNSVKDKRSDEGDNLNDLCNNCSSKKC